MDDTSQKEMSPPEADESMAMHSVMSSPSSSFSTANDTGVLGGHDSFHDDETATISNAKSVNDQRRRKSENVSMSTTPHVDSGTFQTRGIFEDPKIFQNSNDNHNSATAQRAPITIDYFDVDTDNVLQREQFGVNATISRSQVNRNIGSHQNSTVNETQFPRITFPRSEARLVTDTIANQTQSNLHQLQPNLFQTFERPEESATLQDQRGSSSIWARTEMGYTSSDHPNYWSTRSASLKMEGGGDNRTERKEQDDDGLSAASTVTATTLSPGMAPVEPDSTADAHSGPQSVRLPSAAIGTPSTVSTAPSTDDASVEGIDTGAFEKLSIKVEGVPQNSQAVSHPGRELLSQSSRRNPTTIGVDASSMRHSQNVHRRTTSWEESALLQQHGGRHHAGARHGNVQTTQAWTRGQIPPFASAQPRHNHVDAWNGGVASQARVATFRDHATQHGFPPQVPLNDAWRQPRRVAEQHQLTGQNARGHVVQLPMSGPYTQPRKGGYGHHTPMTPPRNRQARSTQQQGRSVQSPSNQSAGSGQGAANPPRSSSEILKTLLRKKACLYEPDTSRAVALVTWLVGCELALQHGYFSRQQLQTGVHACVAKKIESGTITRTKVNRCMQIILNSCFHYIIPRPDGSEENGDAFRKWFSENTQDDKTLLKSLPAPWNDIVVDPDTILAATAINDNARADEKKRPTSASPQGSPRLGSIDSHAGDGEHLSKRAVLLCFNENVRSAEDVFRCHNEFIRDTANASKLQLSAQEWRTFFGQDVSSTPAVWSGQGLTDGNRKPNDVLGCMDANELAKFRTSWCAKRYDHDHAMCGFAHVEVNNGWLRRNPSVHPYRAEMCPHILEVPSDGQKIVVINKCPKGVNCELAHSREEIVYHSDFYKTKACRMAMQGCPSGDVCPYIHPPDSKRQHESRPSTGTQRHGRQHGHQHGGNPHATHGKGVITPHFGSPMLYVHPAPFSSFESQLGMPGLQNLFRRHSAVVQAHLKEPSRPCNYSNFGDDWGIKSKS